MKKILLLMMLTATLTASAQQVEKLQKKVATGDAKAMIELANCYEAGFGVPVDSAQALALFRRADTLGNADARGHLSRYYLVYSGLGHDSVASFRLAQASDAAGSAYGTFRLGYSYIRGVGTPRDIARGHRLLEQAEKKGCSPAACSIARGYLYGIYGYARNLDEAFHHIKKADESCVSLKFGLMASYYNFLNDEKTALAWLSRGINAGSPDAMLEHARYMQYGIGMSANERAALEEYRRLKEKFHGDADYVMNEAMLLAFTQDSTLRDTALALQLFEQMGNVPFFSNYDYIGTSYIYGSFTPVDTAKAYSYWLRGARKKDTQSMVHLAQYHDIQGNHDSVMHYLMMAYNEESSDAAGMLAQQVYEENPMQAVKYALQAADWGDEQFRVGAAAQYIEWGENDKAMECYDRAIANAYYDAYYAKAELTENLGSEKKALKLLEEGGSKGSYKCYGILGKYYENREDYKKAAHYYELAGDPQSDFELASLYVNGSIGDGEADRLKGIELLRRSAAGGNRDGLYWLGYSFSQGIVVEQNYDSAFVLFQQLAAQGDADALMQVAIAYEHGRGVASDTAEALRHFLLAGEAGYGNGYAFAADFYRTGLFVPADSVRAFELYTLAADAPSYNENGAYMLAKCYLDGVGTAKDTAAALPLFRQAAAMGSYGAMSAIGDYYYSGWGGLQRDADSAVTYYYAASQGDDPRGDFMMGEALFEEENYETALQFYTSAASNGSRDAALAYARSYLFGLGTEAQPSEAVELLQQLAPVRPTGDAHYLLAAERFYGLAAPADTAQALVYLDSAIARNNVNAMTFLGNLYASGEGVERDTVKTVELYERAVSQGYVKAMLRLAASYLSGEVAPLNKQRGTELYQMAADRGNLEALCRLGLCYEEGNGVVLNSRKAYNLYTQAAEQGSAYGMFLVAMCYVEGVYVKEDMEQAAQWFLKGAEAGSVQCCYYIGKLYATGEGVKKNKKEAKKWLGIAADNGMEAAEQLLQEL